MGILGVQLLNRLDISKKETLSRDTLVNKSAEKLNSIQNHLLRENQEFLERNIIPCKTLEEFENHWGSQNPRWIITPWEGAGQEEMRLGKKYIRVKGVRWFANLEYKERHEDLILYKKYSPEEYPKYDNYDAINVDKTKDIPIDYEGVMGVPITFLDKYNPKQFEIIKFRKGDDEKDLSINGKTPYFRILIKNKKL